MLIGILEKNNNYFVGKTLSGEVIKINNFQLDKDVEEDTVIDLDINGLEYEKLNLKGVETDDK